MVTIPRGMNPFIAGNLLAQAPQVAQMMTPQPMAQAQTFAPPPAIRPPPVPTQQPAPQATPAGGLAALGGNIGDFLGGDPALAWAAGVLGGGTTGEALGRGFSNALAARQKAAPATTNDLKEYAFAKQQGYQGSFMDFQVAMKKAGATNVDARQMGTIPPGYRAEYDDQGRVTQMVPIPGGPADKSQQDAANQTQTQRQADIVTQDIDRALGIIDQSPNTTTGMGGALLQNVPDTAARDVRGLIDTIKSNVGFDKLQAMRNASPTGGALGQVSERENSLLQATIGNLEQSQSTQQLRDNLNRVWNVYQDIIHGPGNGPARRPLSFQAQAPTTATGPNGQKLMLQNGQWVPFNGQ